MTAVAAVDDIVAANMGLVRLFAYKLHPKVRDIIEFDDLVQEGCIGLVKAAQTFDVSRGFKFSTYASVHVKGRMLDACRAARPGKRYNPGKYHVSSLEATIESYQIENDVLPAFMVDKTADTERDALNLVESEEIQRALSCLRGRHRYVIEQTFLHNRTARAVASELGVSEGRIYQLKNASLERLREQLTA